MTMYNFNNTTFERIKTSKNPGQATSVFLYSKPKQQKQVEQVEQQQQKQKKVIEAQTFGASKVHCCKYQSLRNISNWLGLVTEEEE